MELKHLMQDGEYDPTLPERLAVTVQRLLDARRTTAGAARPTEDPSGQRDGGAAATGSEV